jgi:ABC-type phosphate/phosphonate transport system ATPase subunit
MAAETLLILGESGQGKSTSLRNLNPKETFIISTTSKPLPWRGWKKNYTK